MSKIKQNWFEKRNLNLAGFIFRTDVSLSFMNTGAISLILI